jgi:hypothetical protein
MGPGFVWLEDRDQSLAFVSTVMNTWEIFELLDK